MILNIFLIIYLLFILLLLATTIVNIATRTPSVPTKTRIIDKLLQIADLKKGKKFYDLGCGDGRMLFMAEKKYHTVGRGFEIAPLMYLLARLKQILFRSSSKIHFRNFFHCDLSQADVIFCYLMPAVLSQLSAKLKQECKKGTKIISNTFAIEGLSPAKIFPPDKKNKIPAIYLYKI